MKALKDGDWDEASKQYKRGYFEPVETGGTHKLVNGKKVKIKEGEVGTHIFKWMTDRNTATYDMFIKDNRTFK